MQKTKLSAINSYSRQVCGEDHVTMCMYIHRLDRLG